MNKSKCNIFRIVLDFFIDHVSQLNLICLLIALYPFASIFLFFGFLSYLLSYPLEELSFSIPGLFSSSVFFFPVLIYAVIYRDSFFSSFFDSMMLWLKACIFVNIFVLLAAFLAGYIIKKTKSPYFFILLFVFLFLASGLGFAHYNIRPRTENSVYGLSRIVYWTPNGYSYHLRENCHALYHSNIVLSGTLQETLDESKTDPCNLCAEGN